MAAGRAGRLAFGGPWRQQQMPVEHREVRVRRNHVHAVGLERHPVRDLHDREVGLSGEQDREHALVIGRQVLHDDERHADV